MIPNNAGYYHAAYIVVVVVHVAYAASIWLRRRSVRARLGASGGARPRG